MDVHSQHETLLLGDVDFQIGIVDVFFLVAGVIIKLPRGIMCPSPFW
ncbi:MAG: hypothetical protein K2X86_04375 [Cytophagaceae bacterium]|nr:hypothetical protein [Cytophagaceae bacterium]